MNLSDSFDLQNTEKIELFIQNTLSLKEFSIENLKGDASSKKFFRIHSKDRSWVLMILDETCEKDFLTVCSHFQKHNIFVPKVLGHLPELFAVILEDLGDETLEWKWSESSACKETLYKLAIDEIVKIQNLKQEEQFFFQRAFDKEKLQSELFHGKSHIIEKFFKLNLSSSDSKSLDEEFMGLSDKLSKYPQVLCHRDFHSRNLMVKDNKIYLIDFQDALLGSHAYDLVSLLCDSYVHITPQFQDKMKAYYQTQMNVKDFESLFSLQAMQRVFKACGSFTSFYNLRGETGYLKYVPKTLKALLLYLENSEYPVFKKVIKECLEKDMEGFK